MEGWIKIHRKILESAIFMKPDYFQVWIYILLNVNHEEKKIFWNGTEKVIKPGCGIFSQKKISTELKIPRTTISRILETLKNGQNVDIKTFNKFTEIQVVKWSEYQTADTKRTSNGHQTDTNKNDKKERKELFEIFRKKFPGKKRGLDTEFEQFIKHKDWENVLPLLENSIDGQINERIIKEKAKLFIPPWKNLSTWINQRCWEEETIINNQSRPQSKVITKEDYKSMYQ